MNYEEIGDHYKNKPERSEQVGRVQHTLIDIFEGRRNSKTDEQALMDQSEFTFPDDLKEFDAGQFIRDDRSAKRALSDTPEMSDDFMKDVDTPDQFLQATKPPKPPTLEHPYI